MEVMPKEELEELHAGQHMVAPGPRPWQLCHRQLCPYLPCWEAEDRWGSDGLCGL